MLESFNIIEIHDDKERFMPLLLIGDESVKMIDRYLEQSRLYVGISDGIPVAVCAAMAVDYATIEVKNLAVASDFRCRGIGRSLLEHIESQNCGRTIILGTGETPSTIRFYEKCGYRYSHRVPDFFTINYPGPIIEEGVTLRDMIYLKKEAQL